jgi:putative Holliday junction resolvase
LATEGLDHLNQSHSHVDDSFPTSGRIAAVDFGSVRIGIAICDPDRILASPLEVHPAANWQNDGAYYRQLVASEHLAAFVVGLPIHCDGGESEKSKQCREFARWLAAETSLPVRLFDERFTTTAANERLAIGGFSRKGKKQRVDAIAALVLLESFLEACRYQGRIVGQSCGAEPSGDQGLE